MNEELYDVVVVGSGAAGLAGAVTAAKLGCRVVLLEATELVGGTTAMSGGMVWAPGNRFAPHVDGDRDAALRYARTLTGGAGPGEQVIAGYLDVVNEALEFLHERAGVAWRPSLTYSDYFGDVDGARLGGRSLVPAEYDVVARLPEWADRLRRSPYLPSDLDLDEMELLGMAVKGSAAIQGSQAALEPRWRRDAITARRRARREAGRVCNGLALIAALLESALDAGVEVVLGARVVGLTRGTGEESTRVSGVEVARGEGRLRIGARMGVVLASGGFEHDDQLAAAFLGTRPLALSSPGNVGDGLRLGAGAGAALANMGEALGMPCIRTDEGVVSLTTPRNHPGCIVVNELGRRFVNEGVQYSDLGKHLRGFDATAGGWPSRSAWMVFDATVRDTLSILDLRPGRACPPWVHQAESLEALAASIGVPASALRETVRGFNADIAAGAPDRFARREVWYNRQGLDPAGHAPPPLQPIESPPYFAVRLHDAVVATFGGLLTSAAGDVLDWDGAAIPGLYAAGCVTANPFGPRYPGGGSSIGPALAFGYAAGRRVASALEVAS